MLSLSLLIIGLDNTVLNVALPTLQTHFDASASTLQWIVDAYLLVFAGVLLTMGTLGDRFGRKRALQAGLVLFGVASVLAALAQTADQLIVLRAVMGIGGAMIMPATLSVIMDVFPREERGKAIGIWSAIAGVGIGLGPFVGGLLLEWFSWSSVFWLNVPIVGVALVAGFVLVPESRDPQPGRVRPRSAPACRSRRWSRWSTGSSRRRRAAGPTRSCSAASASRRVLGAAFVALGAQRRRSRCCRSASSANPRFTVASLGVGLVFFAMMGSVFALHAVPAVRARLQRAGGGRGDAAARARPRHRLRRVEPARRRVGRTRVIAGGLSASPAVLSTSLAWTPDMAPVLLGARDVRARALDGRRDGARDRLGHERRARRPRPASARR